MSYGCNGNCFSNYNKDDDDFVIQRLEDIIAICEFLIKHERNSNNKATLKEILDKIDIENEEEEDKNDDIEYYINRYKPITPFKVYPYYHRYPRWDRVTF